MENMAELAGAALRHLSQNGTTPVVRRTTWVHITDEMQLKLLFESTNEIQVRMWKLQNGKWQEKQKCLFEVPDGFWRKSQQEPEPLSLMAV